MKAIAALVLLAALAPSAAFAGTVTITGHHGATTVGSPATGVVNNGTITGGSQTGLTVTGTAAHSVVNHGTISGSTGLSVTGSGSTTVVNTGTIIGTFVFAIMPPLIHSLGIFDIRSLAMSCGVGSGSMLAACTGGLVTVAADHKDTILALAAASNILTYATGLYAGVFVALPLTEWLYRISRGEQTSGISQEARP